MCRLRVCREERCGPKEKNRNGMANVSSVCVRGPERQVMVWREVAKRRWRERVSTEREKRKRPQCE